MRKALLILALIIALSAASGAAFAWSNDLVLSIYGYRSPTKGTPPLTVDASSQLASQVVLVIVDGLRYDSSLQMPHLNHLRSLGAHAVLAVEPPTNSQTAWTTLLSGASPEVSDAPLFDHDQAWVAPMAVDHLFAAATRAGLDSGISGSLAWARLVSPETFHTQFFTEPAHDPDDTRVLEKAQMFLTEFSPAFTLVHLGQVDAAGESYGADSDQYRQAVADSDQHIRTIAETIDTAQGVLLVTSSHGHLDVGGHGGDEPELLRVPFVMVGKNVLPGDYDTVRAIDVAPTVAAVLGIPVPSGARGSIDMRMLTVDMVDRAEKLVQLASQRVRLGNMYLYSINQGQLRETAQGDVLVAMSSLQVKNYESAAELASLSVQQTDQDMLRARGARIWQERARRATPLALLALLLLVIIWRLWSAGARFSILAAPLGTALYHILYVQEGSKYSLSSIPEAGLAATLEPSAVRAGLSLGVGALIVVLGTWRQEERSAFAVVMRTYIYSGLQLLLIAALLAVCTWYNGPRFDWYLPDLTVAFLQFTVLLQMMLTAAIAVPLPLAVLLLQRMLLAISDRYTTRSTTARHAMRG